MPAAATGLHNLYGPTEAAVDVTWWACRRDEARSSVPIGRPIANLRVHVLDRRGQPAPIGVAGELHIGGVGLARGYLGRPELTAEKFVPDPFCAAAGSRLYRTGDLVCHLPDGAVSYLGRIDHQVKVRGFRIELGEIEAALALHPAVGQVLVAALSEGAAGRSLVAYLVLRAEQEGSQGAVSELRSFLRERLPEHLVPSYFVPLAAFPLTPNGKVDRRALPAPGAERPDLEAPYVEPSTDLERAVAAIWRDLLRVDRVGIHDNFFDLGGTSLHLPRVRARLRDLNGAAGRDLPLVDLFRFPTVATLASHLGAAADAAEAARPALGKAGDRGRRSREALESQQRRLRERRGA